MPERDFDSAVPVRVRQEPLNSLNNRFKVDPLIRNRQEWIIRCHGNVSLAGCKPLRTLLVRVPTNPARTPSVLGPLPPFFAAGLCCHWTTTS